MRDRLEGKIQNAGVGGNRVNTEWQLPLSGVHSIMMEKFTQPGEGGLWGALQTHPLSLYLPYHYICGAGYHWLCTAMRMGPKYETLMI
jgi:hypothetical protein